MKKYFLFTLLLLLGSFNVSCAMTDSRSRLGESLSYAEKFLYSITTYWIEGKVMHVDNGMAVVVVATEEECILATAKHLVENYPSVTVSPLNGRGQGSHVKIEAEIVYMDDLEDVAFLVFRTGYRYAAPEVILDENILIGRSVRAFKYSSSGEYKISQGEIIDFWELPDEKKFMVSKMTIEEGFSGSGVFDNAGNLVGLVSGMNADEKFKVAYLVSGPRIMASLMRFINKSK